MIKGLCFVQVKCQKRLPEKFEKNSISQVMTNQEFLLIDRMFLSIGRIGIKNRSSHPETS